MRQQQLKDKTNNRQGELEGRQKLAITKGVGAQHETPMSLSDAGAASTDNNKRKNISI